MTGLCYFCIKSQINHSACASSQILDIQMQCRIFVVLFYSLSKHRALFSRCLTSR